jgi:hypothetical protein
LSLSKFSCTQRNLHRMYSGGQLEDAGIDKSSSHLMFCSPTEARLNLLICATQPPKGQICHIPYTIPLYPLHFYVRLNHQRVRSVIYLHHPSISFTQTQYLRITTNQSSLRFVLSKIASAFVVSNPSRRCSSKMHSFCMHANTQGDIMIHRPIHQPCATHPPLLSLHLPSSLNIAGQNFAQPESTLYRREPPIRQSKKSLTCKC